MLSPSPSGQPWTFPSGVTSRKYLGPVSLPRHSNLVLTPFSCGSENKNFIRGNHFNNPFLPFLSAFPTELFRRSKPRASETFLMDTLSGIFTPHRFWIRVWMKIEKMNCYMESKSNYLKPMKLTKIKNNPIYHSKMSNFLDFQTYNFINKFCSLSTIENIISRISKWTGKTGKGFHYSC